MRILPDNFYGVEQAVIVAKGHVVQREFIDGFIDEARASGFIRAAIEGKPSQIGAFVRYVRPEELPSYAMYLLYLNHNDPAKWARELPAAKAFVDISAWLKQKNIDLLLVPTPRMAEVYGDRLAGNCQKIDSADERCQPRLAHIRR